MKDLASRLREVFRAEAEVDLADLAVVFAEWEATLPNPPPQANEAVFRLAHKIKGACRAVSFQEGQTLGHLLEYLFRAWHESPIVIPAPMAADARLCHVTFQETVKNYLAGDPVSCPPDLVENMNTHLRACGSVKAVTPPAGSAQENPSALVQPITVSPQPASPQKKQGTAILDARLLASFRGEAVELLETLRRHMDSSAGGLDREAVNSAMRAAHTLKGAAGVVRFTRTAALAHELEDLLRTFENVDSPTEPAKDYSPQLAAARGLLDSIESTLQDENNEGGQSTADSSDKGTQGGGANSAGSSTNGTPANRQQSTEVVSFFRIETDRLKKIEDAFADIMVLSPQLDNLLDSSAEISAEFSALAREEETLRHGLGALLYRAPENREYAKAASYINFTSRQLRSLHRGIIRLESRLRSSLNLLDQRLETLDQNLHGIQLTPAREVLSGLDAMVNELSTELGKPAQLKIKGFDLEMERGTLQKIRGALIHLLRNSLDHGVESPAERSLHGKSPIATIEITLSLVGGQYRFVIQDDGRGLRTREIRRRAIAQNFLSESHASRLDEKEIHRLIFHPRFSTIDKTNQVSGRGMGLSSVEETTRALGGSVTVESNPAQGTTFQISLPAGRVGSHVLLASASNRIFGFPAQSVERITSIPAAELPIGMESPHWNSPTGPVPLKELSAILGLPQIASLSPSRTLVLARHGGQTNAILVDEVIGLRKVVLRELPPAASAAGFFGGCIPLAEGDSALLIEITALFHQSRAPASPLLQPASATSVKQPSSRESVILVVDDSYTSRTLEAGVIESMGYRVLQAADGLDGLRVLRNETVDLILCDIEMPRMDGFGMLVEVKKNERMRDIPFILISSLEDPSIVQKGLNLGADSYVVKRHFELEKLRELIDHYL